MPLPDRKPKSHLCYRLIVAVGTGVIVAAVVAQNLHLSPLGFVPWMADWVSADHIEGVPDDPDIQASFGSSHVPSHVVPFLVAVPCRAYPGNQYRVVVVHHKIDPDQGSLDSLEWADVRAGIQADYHTRVACRVVVEHIRHKDLSSDDHYSDFDLDSVVPCCDPSCPKGPQGAFHHQAMTSFYHCPTTANRHN